MTRGRDLLRTRQVGRRFRGRLIDMRLADTGEDKSRIGIVVPRYGRTAVDRNRVKRRLRELVRISGVGRHTDLRADIVIHALPAAYDVSFDMLRSELATLCTRAGL